METETTESQSLTKKTSYDIQANKRSDTGYTILYVQAQNKPMIVIDPDDYHISFSGSEAKKNILLSKKYATNADKIILIR